MTPKQQPRPQQGETRQSNDDREATTRGSNIDGSGGVGEVRKRSASQMAPNHINSKSLIPKFQRQRQRATSQPTKTTTDDDGGDRSSSSGKQGRTFGIKRSLSLLAVRSLRAALTLPAIERPKRLNCRRPPSLVSLNFESTTPTTNSDWMADKLRSDWSPVSLLQASADGAAAADLISAAANADHEQRRQTKAAAAAAAAHDLASNNNSALAEHRVCNRQSDQQLTKRPSSEQQDYVGPTAAARESDETNLAKFNENQMAKSTAAAAACSKNNNEITVRQTKPASSDGAANAGGAETDAAVTQIGNKRPKTAAPNNGRANFCKSRESKQQQKQTAKTKSEMISKSESKEFEKIATAAANPKREKFWKPAVR